MPPARQSTGQTLEMLLLSRWALGVPRAPVGVKPGPWSLGRGGNALDLMAGRGSEPEPNFTKDPMV